MPCTSHTCTFRGTARDHRGLPASSTRALAGSATHWLPGHPSASMMSCWLWWRSCVGRSSSCSMTSSMVGDHQICRCCAGLRKLIFWASQIESWDFVNYGKFGVLKFSYWLKVGICCRKQTFHWNSGVLCMETLSLWSLEIHTGTPCCCGSQMLF